MARKRDEDRQIAKEARFFMADASEAEARAADAARKRARAAERKAGTQARRGPGGVRLTREGEPYLIDMRARSGKTVQCAGCHSILYPLGQPNPGRSLHQEGRGFSDSECQSCRLERERKEAAGKGISVAELRRRRAPALRKLNQEELGRLRREEQSQAKRTRAAERKRPPSRPADRSKRR